LLDKYVLTPWGISHGVFVCGDPAGHEDERKVSAMLILDTELENRSEFPAASQLVQSWAARLWTWLRREPRPQRQEITDDFLAGEAAAGEDSIEVQDCGTGLIL